MVKLSTKSFRRSREFLDTTPPDFPLSSVPNGDFLSPPNKYMEVSDGRDSSDSETDRCDSHEGPCTTNHDGRFATSMSVNINIDELFTMMFTDSQFIRDTFSQRNITEYDVTGEWRRNRQTHLKTRRITFTLPLPGLGPKESFVTETQSMNKCSKPGERYSVDVVAENVGVPYADSFSVLFHNCLQRLTDKSTKISFYGDVKFKKPVWGMVKGFIEKPTIQNLESYAQLLEKNLRFYADASTQKRSHRMRKSYVELEAQTKATRPPPQPPSYSRGLRWRVSALTVLFCLLLVINVQLFLILQKEDGRPCVFRIEGWEDRLNKEDSDDQMQEYLEILEQYTTKQRQQLLTIQQMLSGEIHALKQTEQAIASMIDKMKPSSPKSWRHSDRLRRMIGS